jgi:hypothetical protein
MKGAPRWSSKMSKANSGQLADPAPDRIDHRSPLTSQQAS